MFSTLKEAKLLPLNIIDYIILGIIGVSLLYGLYRGFISSLLTLLALFAAMFVSYAIGPTVAAEICKNDTAVQTLSHYTDAASRLGDLEMSMQPVNGLSETAIDTIVERANLPTPFDTLLLNNMTQQVFAVIGSASVSEYINQTVVTSIISILSYIIIFSLVYFAMTMVIRMLNYMFNFPALKYLDMIFGGVIGVGKGIFFVYIIFALIPILVSVLPFDGLEALVEASRFGSIVNKSSIVTTILRGRI